jgi:pyruvate-formate lyase-activating enzyme
MPLIQVARSECHTPPGLESPAVLLEKALALALPPAPVRRPTLVWTTERRITRRGAIWLGQTCNLRCHFCFFIDRIEDSSHPEHAFMSLEKAKRICTTLVDVYGNNAVDIQGGEPTLWRHILPLVEHCTMIGLRPSIITNALLLDRKEKVQEYQNAGVRDFLVSVHGLGPVHDWAVGLEGAHERQMRALRNLIEVGVPFRINTVLTKGTILHLPQVAQLAARTGAQVVNFLTFLPFGDQATAGARVPPNLPRYSEASGPLTEALDLLAEAGIEANVRFFPPCLLPARHRRSCFNLQQLPYDHREWDFRSLSWTGAQAQRTREGELSPPSELPAAGRPEWLFSLEARLAAFPRLRRVIVKLGEQALGPLQERLIHGPPPTQEQQYREFARSMARGNGYTHTLACMSCDARGICDGVHGDYAALFGTNEVRPISLGLKVTSPTYYVSRQQKIVCSGDESWSLPRRSDRSDNFGEGRMPS